MSNDVNVTSCHMWLETNIQINKQIDKQKQENDVSYNVKRYMYISLFFRMFVLCDGIFLFQRDAHYDTSGHFGGK